jgi:hypothetical protein
LLRADEAVSGRGRAWGTAGSARQGAKTSTEGVELVWKCPSGERVGTRGNGRKRGNRIDFRNSRPFPLAVAQ